MVFRLNINNIAKVNNSKESKLEYGHESIGRIYSKSYRVLLMEERPTTKQRSLLLKPSCQKQSG